MLAQIFAATIFVAMFVLIVIDKIERQWITLGAGRWRGRSLVGYQLGNHYIYCRHDDHGGRYGKSRFLPLAVSVHSQGCELQAGSHPHIVHGLVGSAVYVY